MKTRVEQILQQISEIQASLTIEKQTVQLDELKVLSSCFRHDLWPRPGDDTPVLLAIYSLPLAIHQHGVSLLLLS